jgi:Flp pilus assembly protein TadD
MDQHSPIDQARAAFAAGDLSTCIRLCQSTLRASAVDAPTLRLLGNALAGAGQPGLGAEFLSIAQTLAPQDIALLIDYAKALGQAGRHDAAVALLAAARAEHPTSTDLIVGQADALAEAGRFAEAEAVLTAAVAATPDRVPLRVRLATLYAADLRGEDALAQLCAADRLKPDNTAILTNLGVLYQGMGDLDQAIACYRRALALSPDSALTRVNLGMTLLTRGDFPAGFAALEDRLTLAHIRRPPTTAPLWRGEPLAGKHLLITSEQGYGDMIQFARFLLRLRRFGGRVTVECYAGLERLFAAIPGVAACVTADQPLPETDFTLPMISLPARLGCDLGNPGAAVPYLIPPECSALSLPLAPGPRVGLVWAGKRQTGGEIYVRRSLDRRACPLAALAPLTRLPEIRFYSLQKGDAADELATCGQPITDLATDITDFADTAAAIAALDLVISVDTAVAHLAGALGKPVWLLLAPGQADYRWGRDGDSTLWYPTARLFRADRTGWTGAITAMAAALATWMEQRRCR